MNSTLTLYYNSNILPDRNFKIDSLSTYLSGLTKTTISNFQYIKHNLELTIKKDMSQENLDYLEADNIDYISIQNGNEKVVYYFVINKKWKAQKTIEFELYMDSVNTFNGDYTLSDRTKVTREHKDRWQKVETYSPEVITDTITGTLEDGVYSGSTIVTFETTEFTDYDLDIEIDTISQSVTFIGLGQARVSVSWSEEVEPDATIPFNLTIYPSLVFKAKPIIDFYSEDVNPIQYKKSEEIIEGDGLTWNLLYKNNNYDSSNPDAINPINVYLIPSESVGVSIYSNFNLLNTAPFPYPHEYLVLSPLYNNKQQSIVFTKESGGIDYTFRRSPRIVKSGNTSLLYTYFVDYISSISGKIYEVIFDQADYSLVRKTLIGTFKDIILYCNVDTLHVVYTDTFDYLDYDPDSDVTGSHTEYIIKGINDIDRSDPKIVKIIEYPYCPIEYSKHTISDVVYLSFDGDTAINWTAGGILEIESFYTDNLIAPLNTNIANPLSPLFNKSFYFSWESLDRLDEYEPKLYHSQFYTPKFVYDSFGYNFMLEREGDIEKENNFKCKMVTSTTTNSRFIFDMIQENLKITDSDFSSILLVARNNEALTLNSAYLNYLRIGYNYDVKNKDINKRANITNTIIRGVGAVGSSVMGFASGNVVKGVGSIVSGVSSIAGSIANTIKQVELSELAIQEKKQTTANQSAEVSSSDDLYLMNYYTKGHKAKIVYYEVSERMKELIADLFYYTGYATQEYKIPEENTRMYFNFIQAELVFASSKNISEDILLDIKRRYGEGVTILHHYNNTWDFNQVKENFERSLID